MKYPESARPARPTHPDFGGFRAIQGYASVTCSDWHAFHLWQADDPGFTGVVTVLDHQGDARQFRLRAVPPAQKFRNPLHIKGVMKQNRPLPDEPEHHR